jgi:putative flavoprotein involved in K+ transport
LKESLAVKQIDTIIVGAGQAGLSMSYCLQQRSVPHILFERGDIANSWRTERWDNLRLLTPNWQSRLPGYAYAGPKPDDFMDMAEVVGFLDGYAKAINAPVATKTNVNAVSRFGDGYHVATDKGDWTCRNLVLASGACNRAQIPGHAAGVPEQVTQLSPLHYRNPGQLPAGGVLVVGASATGVQLASEIRAAGHEVILATGQHIRMPRLYRGRDIQWWMDRSGLLATTSDDIDDITRARAVPSLQLVGDSSAQFLDLNTLQQAGVDLVGRLVGVCDGEALFSGSLANAAMLSDLKMNRALQAFDAWASDAGVDGLEPSERFPPTRIPANPKLRLDLTRGQISTVICATGFRPDLSWLHLPVFDDKGRLSQQDGVVVPGLYVLGLPFLRSRNSSLIDGVGADAAAIADHLTQSSSRRAA